MGKQGHWYTPPTTRDYENDIAWTVRKERYSFGKDPLAMRVEFHLPDAKRKDGDNLLKALLDGCEKGGLFDDDKQVVEFTVRLFYSSDNPRTEVEAVTCFEHSHSVYCGGQRSSVEWDRGRWFCSTCQEPIPWLVM
jgi:Holliday junction resolvase RusA-like endonuclease